MSSDELAHRAWHLAGHAHGALGMNLSVHLLSLDGFSEEDLAQRGEAQCLDEGTMVLFPPVARNTGTLFGAPIME